MGESYELKIGKQTMLARLLSLTHELTVLWKDLYKVRYLDEQKDFLVKSRFVGSIKTAFNVACLHAGIEGFDFHDFRQTAVTYMDGQVLIVSP